MLDTVGTEDVNEIQPADHRGMPQFDVAEPSPRGALAGIRVIRARGAGAAPFAAMMLADMGADVIRIDHKSPAQAGDESAPSWDLLNRGRHSVGVELKNPAGVGLVLRLAEHADVLIEGFRPGVMGNAWGSDPRLAWRATRGWFTAA